MKASLRPGRRALFTTRAKAATLRGSTRDRRELLRDSPERAILPLSGVFFSMSSQPGWRLYTRDYAYPS